jgi:antitoxin MazE
MEIHAVVVEDGVQGVVKKWRNSAVVRIPAAVMDAAQVHLDQPVDVREENGRIVIEPLRPARYDRDALIASITDENRHDPVDMGKQTGDEVR